MIIGVQGTKDFNDYSIFLRGILVALSGHKDGDNRITVYSAGPAKINSMAMEFCNISENNLKARGISIKLIKISPKTLGEMMDKIDYFAFFSLPKENESALVREAKDKDVEWGVFYF